MGITLSTKKKKHYCEKRYINKLESCTISRSGMYGAIYVSYDTSNASFLVDNYVLPSTSALIPAALLPSIRPEPNCWI